MSIPKYKEGDDVFYFDSFTGHIIASKVRSIVYDSYQVKTETGGVICTHHVVLGYDLTCDVFVKEYLLFDDPRELIHCYIAFFNELRDLYFDKSQRHIEDRAI